jgi:putative nucleotidyltransferase with HDIG domain
MSEFSKKGINLDLMKSISVLYVEDDDDVREKLAHTLRRRFALLDTAINGQDGLEKFKQNHYDVVITDVRMPVMDGLEMARQVKEIAEDIPIVVVTAFNETDYFLRAIEIGIDKYVKKPVDSDELFEAVNKCAMLHFRQQEIENSREKMLDMLEQTIGTLARAIEMRDPYTDGHQKRVANLAVAIAEELGLDAALIRGIRLATLIHDIGKINIPLEILSRPGKLNPIEFALIKSHPTAGYDVIGDIDFPWPIRKVILEHHEKWDGSGYPNGLKGEDILLEARIVCVADVIEAMASHRPYRAGLGIDAAVAEVRSKSGIFFDPKVVDACMKVIDRKGADVFDA